MTAKGEFRVFVGNLAPGVDNAKLLAAFEQCAALSAKVATDQRTGKPLGFGHVDFMEEEEASDAVLLMNGCELEGRCLSVYIDKLYRGSRSIKVKRTGIAVAAATEAVAMAAASRSRKSPAPSPRGSLTPAGTGGGRGGWDWLNSMRSSFKGMSTLSSSSSSLNLQRSSSMNKKGEMAPGLSARSKSMSIGSRKGSPPSGKQLSSSGSQKTTKSEGWEATKKRMDFL